MKTEMLTLLGALFVLASCQGETLVFDSRDGGTGGGSYGGGGSAAQSGRCIGISSYSESQDGKPCTSGGPAEWNDGCQACQCFSDGFLKCTEFICQPAACPSHLPPTGGQCSGAPCECRYPNACGVDDIARCEGGAWVIDFSDCAPECPAEPPTSGTTCWDQLLRCEYDRAGCSPIVASCIGGGFAGAGADDPMIGVEWLTFAPDCGDSRPAGPGAEVCPAEQPASSQPCSQEITCFYGSDGTGVWRARCNAVAWTVEQRDSGADCPTERPRTGDACPAPDHSAPPCSYADATSCKTDCFCMGDLKWGCFESCETEHGPDGMGIQPGNIPDPFHRCSQGAWCLGLGSTCSSPETSCTCTDQGWSCN